MHADLLKRLLPLAISPHGPVIGTELLAEGVALDAAQWSSDAIIDEADPHTTAAMLADWERVYGLPEPFLPARTLALDPGLYAVTVDDIAAFSQPEVTTYIDAGGQLRYASPNTPRFDYDLVTHEARGVLIEAAATNSIRNNSMLGAAVGSPGSLPTNWGVSMPSGISASVIEVGGDAGIDYVDIRFYGASSAAGTLRVYPEYGVGAAGVAATSGETWTCSFFTRLISGSFTNIFNPGVLIEEFNGAGAYVTGGGATVPLPSSLALNQQRVSATRLLSGGVTVTNIRPWFGLSVNNGVSIDVTLRIGMPQLEKTSAPSSVIKTALAAVTRPADICSIFDRLSPPERVAALVAKVLMQGGQSRAFFIALAAALGYTITITELTPQTTEFDTEAAVADDQYRFIWQVNSALYALRELTTESGTEMPTAVWDNGLLEVVINRYKPAHTLALFAYS